MASISEGHLKPHSSKRHWLNCVMSSVRGIVDRGMQCVMDFVAPEDLKLVISKLSWCFMSQGHQGVASRDEGVIMLSVIGLQVDGVYNCDPLKNPGAVRHSVLSYEEVHQQRLQVMDQTAITLCEENHIPVVVYNLYSDGHLVRVLQGDAAIGTTVSDNASPVRIHLLLSLILLLLCPQILRAPLPCLFPTLMAQSWHSCPLPLPADLACACTSLCAHITDAAIVFLTCLAVVRMHSSVRSCAVVICCVGEQ
jgi:hypothetical protein